MNFVAAIPILVIIFFVLYCLSSGGVHIFLSKYQIVRVEDRYYLSRKTLFGRRWSERYVGSLTKERKNAFVYSSYDLAKEALVNWHELEFNYERDCRKEIVVCDGENHIPKLNHPDDYKKLERQELIDLILAIRSEIPIGYYGAQDEKLAERVADLAKENAKMSNLIDKYGIEG